MQSIFITGIGTDVGKTVVAAMVTEALQAAYWKPVQAGYEEGTDSEWVAERISHPHDRIWPEAYKLALPASPHIAARQEGVEISLAQIARQRKAFATSDPPAGLTGDPSPKSFLRAGQPPGFVVIEGAGGLLVPLNEKEFVLDLVKELDATVILVSRNYLGSINHSLLTATVCRTHGLKVAGWVFNDQYGHYEEEIVQWSGFPAIASIPFYSNPDTEFIRAEAGKMRTSLLAALNPPALMPQF
jgi:dethiobiotin synthetase